MVFFRLARDFDQALLLEHVDVGLDRLEQHLLGGTAQRHLGQRLVDRGGAQLGGGEKPVEHVLGHGDAADDVGAGDLAAGFARARGRRIDDFRAAVAGDGDAREHRPARAFDAVARGLDVLDRALDLGVFGQDRSEFPFERVRARASGPEQSGGDT
jgi:hypothetical protein